MRLEMRVFDWARREAASWMSSGGSGPARPGMRPVRVGSRDLFIAGRGGVRGGVEREV